MRYRPDIDGLRALAVLPVVLYHTRWHHASGGYIGVDVFFVISGYLITGIISSEIREQGRFSIAGFYVRRIRRILPALFAVLLFCLAGTLRSFYPDDLAAFGKSLVATTLFVSNLHFWSVTSYFFGNGESAPLLHTWSLSVEEQFYIVFPLLLLGIYHYLRGRYVAMVALIWVLSFTCSAWLVRHDPTAAFYSPLARAWELMTGSLLALGALPPLRSRKVAEAAGALGFALICYGIVGFTKNTLFPGPAALVPCLGAGLIIYSGEYADTVVARLLRLRPVVFIGLISYSLYLWHWPLLVIGGYTHAVVVSSLSILPYVAVCIAVATLSWRFVERPFRKPLNPVRGTAPVFAWTAGLMACFVALGVIMPLADGFPARFSPAELQMAAYAKYDEAKSFRSGSCFIVDGTSNVLDRNACMTTATTRPNYLLVGDSHAADLRAGLDQAFPAVNLMQATGSGCIPLIPSGGHTSQRCRDIMDYAFNQYLPAHKVDELLLSARWGSWDLQNLLTTINRVRPYAGHIYVFGPSIEYRGSLPHLLAAGMHSGDPGAAQQSLDPDKFVLDRQYRQALRDKAPDVSYISIADVLCPGGHSCQTETASGVPLQFDYGHLTAEGSVDLLQHIVQQGLLR